MDIVLRTDIPIKPWKVTTAKVVPIHYKEKADEMIQKMLQEGIIEKIEKPTDWLASSFFVKKAGSTKSDPQLRLVTDFAPLNAFIKTM